MKTKQQRLDEKIKEAEALGAKMEAAAAQAAEETDADAKADLLKSIPEDQKSYDAAIDEVEKLQAEIVKDQKLLSAKAFLGEPATAAKSAGFYTSAAQVAERKRVLTPGEALIESDAYKSAVKAGRVPNTVVSAKSPVMSYKATFDTTSTGLLTDVNYSAGPILIEQQRLTIRDLMPVGQTTQNQVNFIKETSFTNAAATVAEEGLKPEATFALEDATAPVRKIAVIGRVTDEMWNDFPMLRDYVNMRLRFMVEQEEEDQLLNGSGVGNNITGILNTTGIQTQALGGDTVPDAVYKAMTKIRVATGTAGGFEPTGMVIHPNDWQGVRLTKDGNNQYYGGGPFTGAYGNNGIAPDRLWSLPVVITTAIAEGTALVGAFRLGAQIWQREGINVEATNTHEDDFQYNRMAIRVEERLALAVYRPSAFCTVTGI